MSSNPLLWSILLICVGVGLFGGGIFTFFRQRARKTQWRQAVGVVTELSRSRVSGKYAWSKTEDGWKLEPRYQYRPQIKFKPQTGRSIKFEANLLQNPAPNVGDEVNVLYNPQNPREALINSFWHLWFSTLMLIFFGSFSVGMGFLLLLLSVI